MGAQSASRGDLGHAEVLKLAWPIMVQMLSFTGITVVNSIWVGRLGTSGLAAIGLASGLMYVVTAAGQGLLGSVRVHVANRTGAGRPDEADAFAWHGIGLALVLGLAVASLAGIGPWAFALMGGSPDVIGPASDYYRWRTLGTPIGYLSTALMAAFQGKGDTRTPMIANLLANALNLVLDPILIFGLGPIPALGTGGAAIGAVIATGASLGLLAWRARGALGPAPWPDPTRLRAIFRLGAPVAVQNQLDVASFTVFAALLARAGEDHLAAHVIVVRIVMVSFLPCYALSEATAVLVGQSLGARAPARARQALRLATIEAAVLMTTLGVLFASIPDALTWVFGATDAVRTLARPVIVLYAVFQVLDGMAVVTSGALSGAGDTRFVLRLTVGTAWLAKLPVATLLVCGLHLGVLGAWIGICAEFTTLFVLARWRASGTRWLAAAPVEAAPALAK